ncbi:Hemopexin-like domain and Hemopexin-like repeat-containing protein [Aphelenchoides bicaudatus]|nr:Hemopexin-like domain and Hemopexin-like repeat-containing protein [Aphelenchoides bicaudatus]
MRGLTWTLILAASWVLYVSARPHKNEILESKLDVNRSYVDEYGERLYVPKRLPKLTREEKFAFLQEQGIDTSHARHKKPRKHRRSLNDKPWRIQQVEQREKPKIRKGPLLSVDPHLCPNRFDAITEAQNHRTYVFSGSYVYQIWRENGLQQKAAYKISDFFPNGPQTVTAALTNLRSGVTVLIQRRKVYRFRWNKKEKQFYQARKSPVDLPNNITFTPTLAFQWKDGHLVLSDGSNFVTYDPFWNVATYTGKITDYFPNVPADAIGLAHKNGPSTFLLLTSNNELEVYDMNKFKIVQEYPLSVHNYVACMSKALSYRSKQ